MATCDDGGMLVGTEHPIPADPHARFTRGGSMLGCNHIVCQRCHATVRHFDRVQLSRELLSGDEYAQLWAAANASAFPLLRASVVPQIRFYFCQCFNFYTAGAVSAPSREDADWTCGGH